ncbi:MAG: sigma-70 family RNA polymerase sigma factor [Acidobacteriota bacterium]|nr:sigma-70 family RNA polymerase sigma factor [Acidobacteriota bacterium]
MTRPVSGGGNHSLQGDEAHDEAAQDEAAQQAAELVQRIQAGDESAEAELVRRYSRGLSYMLRRLTSDRSLAEDLHQDTLRVVIEKARGGEITHPERLNAFLRGTARNLLMAEIRKRGRRRTEVGEAPVKPVDPTPGPAVQMARAQDRQLVRRLLQELSQPRDREILFRFYLAEESKEVLCRDLGLQTQQFNLVLFRARQRFRQLLEQAEALKEPSGVKE